MSKTVSVSMLAEERREYTLFINYKSSMVIVVA